MNRYGIGIEQRQVVTTRLEQRLVITPQLQQAIKLLQLNHLQLAEMLQEEMLENPLLDETEEEQREEALLQGEAPPEEAEPAPAAEELEAATVEDSKENEEVQSDMLDDFDWESYIEDMDFSSMPSMPSNRERPDSELPSLEARLSEDETLSEELMAQLRMVKLDRDSQRMALMIIGSINEDGWLVIEDQGDREALDLLAEQMSQEELKAYEGLDPADYPALQETPEERFEYWKECAEEALEVIHDMEPYGVAARSLEECLLLQCRQRDDLEDRPLIERLISNHIKQIERKSYAAIAKKIKISLEEIVAAVDTIGQFDPHPGQAYVEEPSSYISPDIHIEKVGDEYTITQNDDGLPKLKISQYYKQALKSKGDEKEFVQDKLRNATWLLRSIHQRQRTIYKVTESIIKRQKEFLDKGVEYLKPMILRDVAQDIDMHESTISRVTTNKYVHTPQGVFELKFFFTSSLRSNRGGEDISSLTVKQKIKNLVSNEDPKTPLSDQQIVRLLGREGIKIARRTVAKYRDTLSIPSSTQRKQPY